MNIYQRYWLAGVLAVMGYVVVCPPWRIQVIQRGDDRSVVWRSAPIWGEAAFSAEVMALVATERLGVAVPPSGVEARLHGERAWWQLAGVFGVGGVGWCLLGAGRGRGW